MTLLSTYLIELAGRKWRWGESDCLLVLADWIDRATGIDVGAEFRHTYTTENACREILLRHRGVLRLFSSVMDRYGFKQVDAPKTGDVAIVRAPCYGSHHRVVLRHTGAIIIKDKSVLFTPDKGVVIAPVPVSRAWSVPCQ